MTSPLDEHDAIGTIPVAPDSTTRPPSRRRRPRRPRRRFPWRLPLAVVALLAMVIAIGPALLPRLLPDLVAQKLTERLHRSVTIGRAAVEIADGRLVLGNIIVGPHQDRPEDDADPFFAADRIVIDLSFGWRRPIGVRHVTLDSPFLHCIRFPDDSTNLDGFWDAFLSAGPTAVGAGLAVKNGRMRIDDRKTGRRHTVDDIHLSLPSMTEHDLAAILERGATPPHFRARVNGSPLSIEGRIQDDGEGRTILFRLGDIDLADYVAYLPRPIKALVAGGQATTDLAIGMENGTVRVSGTLVIHNPVPAPPLAGSVDTIRIDLAIHPDRNTIRCQQISLDRPHLTITRNKAGAWQLPDLTAEGVESGWRFDLGTIRANGGTLEIVDQAVAGGFATRLTEAAVQFDSTSHTLHIEAKSAPTGPLRLDVTIASDPWRLTGRAHLQHLDLAALAPYLHGTPLHGGRLTGVEGDFVLSDRERRITKLNFTAADLLCTPGAHELTLPAATVTAADIDFPAKTFAIDRLKVARPAARLRRSKAATNETSTAAWRLTLHSAIFEAVDYLSPTDDHALLRLEDLQILDYDTAGGNGRIAGTLKPAAGGALQFSGTVHPRPFAITARGILDDLPLAPHQTILLPRLDATVKQGNLRGRGEFTWPQFSFRGDLAVANLRIERDGATLLAWNEAQAQQVNLDGHSFSCQTLTLDRPLARWRIDGPSRTSLSGLFGKKANDASSFSVRIEEMVLTGGRLLFTDHRLTPPFSLTVEEMNGSVVGLANRPDNRCQVSLQGRGPEGSRLAVEGKIGFFAPGVVADCTARVQGLPLVLVAPYIAPELGHEIDGGTVDIASRYQRHDGRIDADNDLVIRDLALGKPLWTISHLPLTLALLTDPDGALRLSLPVHGNLADADFSFQASMLGVLRNLLLQTAVTPFAILKKVLPTTDAPDLGWVDFAAGSAELPPPARRRLEKLAEALQRRPALALTITGRADLGRDRLALETERRKEELERRFARQEQVARQLARRYRGEELGTTIPQPSVENELATPVSRTELEELARRRAQAVAAFLTGQGIAPNRLTIAAEIELVPEDALGRPGTTVRLQPTAKIRIPAVP